VSVVAVDAVACTTGCDSCDSDGVCEQTGCSEGYFYAARHHCIGQLLWHCIGLFHISYAVIRKYSFCNRVTNLYNSLPDVVVTAPGAPSLNIFKNRLDKHWVNQYVL